MFLPNGQYRCVDKLQVKYSKKDLRYNPLYVIQAIKDIIKNKYFKVQSENLAHQMLGNAFAACVSKIASNTCYSNKHFFPFNMIVQRACVKHDIICQYFLQDDFIQSYYRSIFEQYEPLKGSQTLFNKIMFNDEYKYFYQKGLLEIYRLIYINKAFKEFENNFINLKKDLNKPFQIEHWRGSRQINMGEYNKYDYNYYSDEDIYDFTSNEYIQFSENIILDSNLRNKLKELHNQAFPTKMIHNSYSIINDIMKKYNQNLRESTYGHYDFNIWISSNNEYEYTKCRGYTYNKLINFQKYGIVTKDRKYILDLLKFFDVNENKKQELYDLMKEHFKEFEENYLNRYKNIKDTYDQK